MLVGATHFIVRHLASTQRRDEADSRSRERALEIVVFNGDLVGDLSHENPVPIADITHRVGRDDDGRKWLLGWFGWLLVVNKDASSPRWSNNIILENRHVVTDVRDLDCIFTGLAHSVSNDIEPRRLLRL
jgi:hypothetical protein